MNKRFFVLAFISSAFFFACSADGIFESGNPGSVNWSKDNIPKPSSSSNGGSSDSGNGNGACMETIFGGIAICTQSILFPTTEEDCQESQTFLNECPSDATDICDWENIFKIHIYGLTCDDLANF